MSNKLTGFFVESLYGSFVMFFYYYIFTAVVQLRPFAIGFHPITNVEDLSVALIIITLSVTTVKLVLGQTGFLDESSPEKRIWYTPGEHR